MLSKQEPESRRLWLVFAVLFVIHAALLFFDYGRLPIAPVLGDEVIINDPAVALSIGHGFRADSFPGSPVGIDRFYGHFPPLYQLIEAVIFRLLGFSVYTLRLTSSLADLACMAIFLAGLAALWRWKLAERSTLIPFAMFGTLNAVYITMNRMARPDSTVGFFGLLSFLIIVAALYREHDQEARPVRRLSGRDFGLLMAGGVAMGLGLATHVEAILAAVIIVSVVFVSKSPSVLQKLASCSMMPVTFLAVWCGTLRGHSLEGWKQMQSIAHIDTIGKNLPGIFWQWQLLTQEHNYRAESAYILMFLEAILLLCALPAIVLWTRRWKQQGCRSQLGIALAISCVINLLIVQFVLPTSPRRFGLMLPELLFGLAIVLPRLSEKGHRILNGTAGLFGAASLGMLALYFSTDRRGDGRFDPARFSAVVTYVASHMPPDGRVVAGSNLWLAFRQRGIPVTLIYSNGFDELNPYRERPQSSLSGFSTIVLLSDADADLPFLPAASVQRSETVIPIGHQPGQNALIFETRPR